MSDLELMNERIHRLTERVYKLEVESQYEKRAKRREQKEEQLQNLERDLGVLINRLCVGGMDAGEYKLQHLWVKYLVARRGE